MQVLTKAWLLLKHWTVPGGLGGNSCVPWHMQDRHLKQYASRTAYAEPLLQGYLTAPLQDHLCHSCFAGVSFYHLPHYFIHSTSVGVTKIQADFSEESIVYSLIQLTSEELVSLGLPFHFSTDTWKSHDVSTSFYCQESEPGKDTYEQCTVYYRARKQDLSACFIVLVPVQRRNKHPRNYTEVTRTAVNYASSEKELGLAMDYKENWANLRIVEGPTCYIVS